MCGENVDLYQIPCSLMSDFGVHCLSRPFLWTKGFKIG